MTNHHCQVVNLGAGFDTQFWNLVDQNEVPSKWVDVDFDLVTSRKVQVIRKKKQLLEKLNSNGMKIILYWLSAEVCVLWLFAALIGCILCMTAKAQCLAYAQYFFFLSLLFLWILQCFCQVWYFSMILKTTVYGITGSIVVDFEYLYVVFILYCILFASTTLRGAVE